MRDGYQVTYEGEIYEASPDGETFRLYSAEPRDGFAKINPKRYRKIIPADEAENFCYARTTCTWRGEPFIVLGEHEGWLRVEYTGGKSPVAATLGLEEFDFAVYQGWAPANEVTDMREYRV
jgi:hypothetical protein